MAWCAISATAWLPSCVATGGDATERSARSQDVARSQRGSPAAGGGVGSGGNAMSGWFDAQ